MSLVRLVVRLADDSSRTVLVSGHETVAEVEQALCRRLDVPLDTPLGLWRVIEHRRRIPLSPSLSMSNVLATLAQDRARMLAPASKTGSAATAAAAAAAAAPNVVVALLRMVFPNRPVPSDPTLLRLLFHQVCECVIKGGHPVATTAEALFLAGLQAVAVHGPYSDACAALIDVNRVIAFVPLSVLVGGRVDVEIDEHAWVQRLREAYRDCRARTQEAAMTQYLQYTKRHEAFGSFFFPAQVLKQEGERWFVANKVFILVSSTGLLVLDLKTKEILRRVLYTDIMSWTTSAFELQLKIAGQYAGQEDSMAFATSVAVDVVAHMQPYIDWIVAEQKRLASAEAADEEPQ